MCTTPEAYEGSALKGGQYPLGYIQPYHLSTSLPIHHHGGHLPQQPYPCMCNWGLVPTRGYVLPFCGLGGFLWMFSLWVVGPLVRGWGGFRNTLGSLRPLSAFFFLGSAKLFFLILGQFLQFF